MSRSRKSRRSFLKAASTREWGRQTEARYKARAVWQALSGLPVGIQIMGPYLEDATPIDVALKLTQTFGGFALPPGYNDV